MKQSRHGPVQIYPQVALIPCSCTPGRYIRLAKDAAGGRMVFMSFASCATLIQLAEHDNSCAMLVGHVP